MHLIYVKVYC